LPDLCADSGESAVAAERGGAHRIEWGSDLIKGRVTPSAGLLSTVHKRLSIDVYVMVRPRGGDFCYSTEEFETMEQDVLTAKRLGADAGSCLAFCRKMATFPFVCRFGRR
jgi:copper homeostasis protein